MATTAVIGTDGQYPIIDDEPLFRIWSLAQIWLGKIGLNKYVVKQLDWVVDNETFEWWVVDHVDPVTLIPTLRPFNPGGQSGSFDQKDTLTSDGPGSPSEVYRIYLNDSVYPHVMNVDAACYIRGSMASYARVFQGVDTTEASGKIISKTYDTSGNFVGVTVPLEIAAIDSHTNYATKCVTGFYCTEKFKNDELLTLVVYTDTGNVVYKRQLLVENTDTIADLHSPKRYIRDIALESPWLANNSNDHLEFPLNIPMNALNMVGVVQYSDGEVRYPVDGTKFIMEGSEGMHSAVPGQRLELALKYVMGKDELAATPTGVTNGIVMKPFYLTVVNPNNSVAVKLYGYPEWVSDALGYSMRWFLMNAERNVYFEVTQYVQFAENTGPFLPKSFGILQRKSVMLNLNDVSPAFIPFNHSQQVDIVLQSKPTNDLVTAWSVGTEASDSVPRYGFDVYGKIVNDKVNFAAGFETKEAWLDAFYYRTRPIVDVTSELVAPIPTHFIVHYGNSEVEYTIDLWNHALVIGQGVAAGKMAFLRFVRRTAAGDQQLSWSGVLLKSIL